MKKRKALKTGQKRVGGRTVLKKGYRYAKNGRIVKAKGK
jgi:DNA-binding winged helix-turn-helix (wHTH) protein